MALENSENIFIFLQWKTVMVCLVSSTFDEKSDHNSHLILKIGQKSLFWHQNRSKIGPK